jgi:activating signal cointegrator complex subunit 3
MSFIIPVFQPVPAQVFIKLVSMEWLHAAAFVELNLQDIIMPMQASTHTDLLDLEPLPKECLKNAAFERLYQGRFTHFNPIQTQAFHTLYHTDESVLLGAPTGVTQTAQAYQICT